MLRETKNQTLKSLCAAGLVTALLMSGCQSASAESKAEFTDAQTLLNTVWEKEESEYKPDIIGISESDYIEDAPAAFGFGEPNILVNTYIVPDSLVEASVSGAGMSNAMNSNSFTASAWQLEDSQKMDELAQETKEKITSENWMCMLPEEYQILQMQDYLVVTYGLSDQVDPFVDACKQVDASAKVLFEGPVE